MSCARCGCGIYKTEEFICLNKVWHKYCFTCFQCNKRLDKESAKIFQGELFCQCCYSSVIEKLFEVISKPTVKKPSKIVSTPSCTVSKTFLQKLKICPPCEDNCSIKEFCFPKDNNKCSNNRKTVRSCSCIPSATDKKDEFCFTFPIPREVANYYNRAHMKNRTCIKQCCNQRQIQIPKCPIGCCSEPKPQCTMRICQNQNQYFPEDCPPRCTNPRKCCCTKPPTPCVPVHCQPLDHSCCIASCPQPQNHSQCLNQTSSYQLCKYCQKPSCPNSQFCPPTPKCYCTIPPSIQWCPRTEKPCCPPKPQKWRCICKPPPTCCPPMPKYCICGRRNPCNCKMSDIKALCTVYCKRCGKKVYAAEKVQVTSGAFHTNCFTCYCCKKYLDVKNVYEGCGEIYCKQCYNHFFGIQYYGFGRANC